MNEEEFNPGTFAYEWDKKIMKKCFHLIQEERILYGMMAFCDIGKTPIMLLNFYLPDNLSKAELIELMTFERYRMLMGRMVKQILEKTGLYKHIKERQPKTIPAPSNKPFSGFQVFKSGALYRRVDTFKLK